MLQIALKGKGIVYFRCKHPIIIFVVFFLFLFCASPESLIRYEEIHFILFGAFPRVKGNSSGPLIRRKAVAFKKRTSIFLIPIIHIIYFCSLLFVAPRLET